MLQLRPETLYQISRDHHQQLLNQAYLLHQIRKHKATQINLLHYLLVAGLGLLLALAVQSQA